MLRRLYENCPICGGTLGRAIGSYDCTGYPHHSEQLPKSLTWLSCLRCGHIHTDGYWTAEGLQLLLAQAHDGQFADTNFDQKRFVWAPVVQAVIDLLEAPELIFEGQLTWLDIGCGDGALVMTASEFGFNALGLDVRKETVQRILALGYKAIECDFLNMSVSDPIDVVSMTDVLEHLPFPIPSLRKAHHVLKPNGVLLLSCPNTESVSWQAMDRARSNPYWVEMEHCHNFSRRLLTSVIRDCGFLPLRYSVSQRYKAGMEIFALKVSE
jgi:protein O-GlcNAc transferase